ncbi:MAG: adenine phosphoribosyltransferase [Planctomycetes bacterium]|nr:adenine phosphoribosyltransferase [Planctomycetota bacterium]
MATLTLSDRLSNAIRDVPDFPKPGIVFKDITPILQDAALFSASLDALAEAASPLDPTHIAAIESRGFLFAGGLCERLGASLILLRKPGKLPSETFQQSYTLEYGEDHLEVHADAAGPADRVFLVDDLLATGGTAAASAALVRRTGAELVGAGFLVELSFLSGRERLHGFPVHSLIDYPSES